MLHILPSLIILWFLKIPSCFALSRWIAFRDIWFKTSVLISTAIQPSFSKAYFNIKNFDSVFTAVLRNDLDIHVCPISTLWLSSSILRNLVVPIIFLVCFCTMINGIGSIMFYYTLQVLRHPVNLREKRVRIVPNFSVGSSIRQPFQIIRARWTQNNLIIY